jgi:hypothetical protein
MWINVHVQMLAKDKLIRDHLFRWAAVPTEGQFLTFPDGPNGVVKRVWWRPKSLRDEHPTVHVQVQTG